MKIEIVTALALAVLGATAAPLENSNESSLAPRDALAMSEASALPDGISDLNDRSDNAGMGQADQGQDAKSKHHDKSKKHHDESKHHDKSKKHDGKSKDHDKKHCVSVSGSIVSDVC